MSTVPNWELAFKIAKQLLDEETSKRLSLQIDANLVIAQAEALLAENKTLRAQLSAQKKSPAG